MADPEPARRPLAALVISRVLDLGIFVLGAPLAMWVLVSLVIPALAALAENGTARFVTYLEGLQQWEQRQAALATPRLAWDGRELLAAAWPYEAAHATVQRLVPEPAAGDPSASTASPAAGDRVTRTLGRRLTAWVERTFYPVQRAWGTMFLTRGWYALQLALLAVPAAFLAFFLGEYAARLAQEQGRSPNGLRFQAWLHTCRMALAAVPFAMALPVPLPTVPSLLLCLLLALVALSRARAHFVDV
jgi:hypothetical protein